MGELSHGHRRPKHLNQVKRMLRCENLVGWWPSESDPKRMTMEIARKRNRYMHIVVFVYIYIIICMHIHMHKIDECNEDQSTIKTMKNGTPMVIKALVGDIQPNSMETNLVAPVVRADEHSPTTCNNWVCRDMCCSFWACMLLSCCKCTSWTCFWRNALLDSAITCVPKDVCDVRSKSAKTWGNTWIRKTAVGLHPFHHCGSSICLSVMGSSKHNAVFAMMFAECVHFFYILCRLDLKWIKMI